MSTYSLDTDANTFDWNSSLAVQAKPPVFVSLSVCLWALLVCTRPRLFTCVFNEDQRACSISSVSSAHMRVGKFVCSMCRRVQCCCFLFCFFSSQCDWQQPLIGLSPSGPGLPLGDFKASSSQGRGGNIQTACWDCICTAHVCGALMRVWMYMQKKRKKKHETAMRQRIFDD